MFGSRKIKGSIADRSWSATLASLHAAGQTGQLTVKSDGKLYQIAFSNGAIVGAQSPAPCDSIQRIALSTHAIPPTSVAVAVRVMGRSDDIEKFTDAAGLGGAAAARFKRRVLVQRAARTFALENGEYVFEQRTTIPTISGTEVDVRAVIFHGLRMHVPEQKLTAMLRALGSRFILFPEDAGHVERFDLDAEAAPIIAALREGTSGPELEARCRELDPRLIYAVLTALACTNVIGAVEAKPQDVSIPRAPTRREPTVSRVPTPRQPLASSNEFEVELGTPAEPSFARGSSAGPNLFDTGAHKTVMRPAALTVPQIKLLIAQRTAMLERGVDLFAFLGVPFGAPVTQVRAAYLEIARYLRPERLLELGIADERDEARAVFAQAVIALTTLTDARRRAEYVASIARNLQR